MHSLDVTDPDSAWLMRLRRNEESALREIMDAYFDRVATLVLRYVGSREIASDVAQDAFVRLWEQRHHLAADTVVRAYLFRVARNRAIDTLRQDARILDLERRVTNEYVAIGVQSDNAGVAKVDADEFHRLVYTVAHTLTPRVREVLLLYFEQQLEPAEIAAVTGVAPKTVYAQLRTALQHYAKALAGRWP